MNDDHDPSGAGDLEEELVRSLERRAGQVAPVRLSLDTVARSAARRRRARALRLAGAAAGAVAAVAVVLALLPRADDPSDRPPTAPTSTPSPPAPTSPSASPSPADALADVPRGAAPGVGVLTGGTLSEPDGAVEDIPAAARSLDLGVAAVVRSGDALLVGDNVAFEGTTGLFLVEDGEATELGPCTSGGAATSPDGRAAWVTFGCPESGVPAPTLLVRRAADGTTTSTVLTLPDGENVLTSAVGILGDRVVVTRGFVGGAFLVDPDGTLVPLPGLTTLSAVSPEGSLAVASLRGEEPTSVVDLSTGRVLWRAPDLISFSPGGDLVVSDYDRPAVRAARTGRVLATLAPPDGVRIVGVPVWEDGRHLLAVAKDGSGRAVLRLGLDGTVERAGPALPARGQVLLVP